MTLIVHKSEKEARIWSEKIYRFCERNDGSDTATRSLAKLWG